MVYLCKNFKIKIQRKLHIERKVICSMQNIYLWVFIFVLFESNGIVKCFENQELFLKSGADTRFYIFPDDVHMTQIRCEEATQGNDTLKKLWTNKEFPNDNITHCYVKCFLKRLGLINLITRGLDQDKFYQLWDNMDLESSDFCLEELDLFSELDGRCISYYEKWIQMRQKCSEFIKNVFYELGPTHQYSRKFQLPIKTIGMSAIEYCESMDTEETNDAAEVTDDPNLNIEYEVEHLKFNIPCIFKRFYYFDAYGRLDPLEIIRSFKDVFALVENGELAIKGCTHYANAKYSNSENSEREMAYSLNACLMERFGIQFKFVMTQRNQLTISI